MNGCRWMWGGREDPSRWSDVGQTGKWYDFELVQHNMRASNAFGFVEFQDGHVEVRWPESPDQWSYYVSMDAAMVAAELRGYSRD